MSNPAVTVIDKAKWAKVVSGGTGATITLAQGSPRYMEYTTRAKGGVPPVDSEPSARRFPNPLVMSETEATDVYLRYTGLDTARVVVD